MAAKRTRTTKPKPSPTEALRKRYEVLVRRWIREQEAEDVRHKAATDRIQGNLQKHKIVLDALSK